MRVTAELSRMRILLKERGKNTLEGDRRASFERSAPDDSTSRAPEIFPNREARLDGSETQEKIARQDQLQACERSYFFGGLKRKKAPSPIDKALPDGD